MFTVNKGGGPPFLMTRLQDMLPKSHGNDIVFPGALCPIVWCHPFMAKSSLQLASLFFLEVTGFTFHKLN